MNDAMKERGLVLVCNAAGLVNRILRDDLGLGARIPPGTPFTRLVDNEATAKAQAFVEELQLNHAAHDWEITVPLDAQLTPLHFSGARVDEGFLVVVAGTRDDLHRINEELMRINNEQANALRSAAKDLALRARSNRALDDDAYEQLTRVNNELANLQREMAQKNAELQKLNETKNRFLGMAAHDLRSPLGVILTYAEFLEAEATPVLNEEQREFVATIRQTSEFMLNLVNDLLDVSTIESGRLELQRALIDVAALVERNVTLNRALAARKRIAVDFVPPAGGPVQAELDAGKIQQVLNNLLTNAVHYSHADTRVVVTLEASRESVTVKVRDQGQGIPAEELPKLFRPFGRTRVRATAGEQSTGLGLAIARRIVEGHGGKLTVESQVGRGSEFQLVLPRFDPQ
jgi:two-component system, OmpR family, sensor kinase